MSTEALQTGTERPVWTKRSACRACHRDLLLSVLDLGHDVYLPRWVDAKDEALPKAPLELVRCNGCGLLQLGHQVDPDLLYREFWYRTGMNQTMRDAMVDLVGDGLRYHHEGSWLDIGANDGYLLSLLNGFKWRRVACEPARNFSDELLKVSDEVVTDYFNADSCDGPYDIITSAACFYDVNEPGTFVRDIKKVLAPGGMWINQLNDSPTMLRQNAFDSICHEHACYYDVPTLRRLYGQYGLTIINVSHNDVNGGSVRITATHSGSDVREGDFVGLPGVTLEDSIAFARRTEAWRSIMLRLLSMLVYRGPVYGYGASTKGSVLLQYLGNPFMLAAIADKNERKHGKLLAGTWTPVCSEDEMRAAKPQGAVVLPWAFRSEFVERERELRAAGTPLIFPLPNIEVVL